MARSVGQSETKGGCYNGALIIGDLCRIDSTKQSAMAWSSIIDERSKWIGSVEPDELVIRLHRKLDSVRNEWSLCLTSKFIGWISSKVLKTIHASS